MRGRPNPTPNSNPDPDPNFSPNPEQLKRTGIISTWPSLAFVWSDSGSIAKNGLGRWAVCSFIRWGSKAAQTSEQEEQATGEERGALLVLDESKGRNSLSARRLPAS